MCGRYASSGALSETVEEFQVDEVEECVRELPPRYNIAPTDTVAAVVDRSPRTGGAAVRKLVGLRWGLVPGWSRGPSAGPLLINARAETVAEKPSFRKAFAARRCLLPADGYYEWYRSSAGGPGGRPMKQPFFIHPRQGSLLMAGIYEFWRAPAGEWLASCAVITTTATDALGHLHDRMPMTVTDIEAWLDPEGTDSAAAHDLLAVPADLDAYAVSTLVSNVRNDGPELLAPLATEPG